MLDRVEKLKNKSNKKLGVDGREVRTSNQQQVEREEATKVPEMLLMKMQKRKVSNDENENELERKKKRQVDYTESKGAGNSTLQNKVRKSKTTTNNPQQLISRWLVKQQRAPSTESKDSGSREKTSSFEEFIF